MTFRMVASYGLIAGLPLTEMRMRTPGFVCDMFLLRRRYDDEQHGIRRKREDPDDF